MTTQFNSGRDNESAIRAVSVTPNDSDPLPNGRCRALWVGTPGDINLIVVTEDGPVLHKNVPSGILPVACYAVKDELTTASDLVAWY